MFAFQEREDWEARKKLKETEKNEVRKLELLVESAKAKGRSFLNIRQRWDDNTKASFQRVLTNYSSKKGREACCALAGLTVTLVKSSINSEATLFATNLGLTTTEPRKAVLDFIRKAGTD